MHGGASKPVGLFYNIVKTTAKLLCRVCYRHENIGQTPLLGQGAVIASNHTSFLDPVFIGGFWEEEVHFLARSTLFSPRWFGALLKSLNTHPIERGKRDFAALHAAGEVVTRGKKLVIFPEGKRSESEEIQPLKRGIAILAEKNGCPVIPVYIHGAYNAYNRTHKFPRIWKRTSMSIGEPIYWKDVEGEEQPEEAFLKRVRDAMCTLQEERRACLRGS